MKKGSLNLSVNAIVVIVIAFVVMGLALTFTQIIFKGGREKLEEAIGVPEFGREATASNSITLPDTVNLQVGKSTTLKFQYYNKNSDTAANVSMLMRECLSSTDDTNTYVFSTVAADNPDELPSLSPVVAKSVGPSQVYEFKTVLRANDAPADLYICTVEAIERRSATVNDVTTITYGETYDEKTVYLKIAS